MNIPASLFGTAATITLLSVFNVPARDGIQIDPDPPASLYSPTESMAKIKVPEGFKLELVAAEPLIEEPVCMAWGPDGELYVAEMRSYMQDIDMGGELKPVSRVVKLVDTDGDGRMDQATTYLDNLVLPRAILTLDNKVLIGGTSSLVVRRYQRRRNGRYQGQHLREFWQTRFRKRGAQD